MSSASVVAWHVLQSFAFRDNFLHQINYHCRNDERADDCGADPKPTEVVFAAVVGVVFVVALVDVFGIGEGVFEDVGGFVGVCGVVFGRFDFLNVDVVEHCKAGEVVISDVAAAGRSVNSAEAQFDGYACIGRRSLEIEGAGCPVGSGDFYHIVAYACGGVVNLHVEVSVFGRFQKFCGEGHFVVAVLAEGELGGSEAVSGCVLVVNEEVAVRFAFHKLRFVSSSLGVLRGKLICQRNVVVFCKFFDDFVFITTVFEVAFFPDAPGFAVLIEVFYVFFRFTVELGEAVQSNQPVEEAVGVVADQNARGGVGGRFFFGFFVVGAAGPTVRFAEAAGFDGRRSEVFEAVGSEAANFEFAVFGQSVISFLVDGDEGSLIEEHDAALEERIFGAFVRLAEAGIGILGSEEQTEFDGFCGDTGLGSEGVASPTLIVGAALDAFEFGENRVVGVVQIEACSAVAHGFDEDGDEVVAFCGQRERAGRGVTHGCRLTVLVCVGGFDVAGSEHQNVVAAEVRKHIKGNAGSVRVDEHIFAEQAFVEKGAVGVVGNDVLNQSFVVDVNDAGQLFAVAVFVDERPVCRGAEVFGKFAVNHTAGGKTFDLFVIEVVESAVGDGVGGGGYEGNLFAEVGSGSGVILVVAVNEGYVGNEYVACRKGIGSVNAAAAEFELQVNGFFFAAGLNEERDFLPTVDCAGSDIVAVYAAGGCENGIVLGVHKLNGHGSVAEVLSFNPCADTVIVVGGQNHFCVGELELVYTRRRRENGKQSVAVCNLGVDVRKSRNGYAFSVSFHGAVQKGDVFVGRGQVDNAGLDAGNVGSVDEVAVFVGDDGDALNRVAVVEVAVFEGAVFVDTEVDDFAYARFVDEFVFTRNLFVGEAVEERPAFAEGCRFNAVFRFAGAEMEFEIQRAVAVFAGNNVEGAELPFAVSIDAVEHVFGFAVNELESRGAVCRRIGGNVGLHPNGNLVKSALSEVYGRSGAHADGGKLAVVKHINVRADRADGNARVHDAFAVAAFCGFENFGGGINSSVKVVAVAGVGGGVHCRGVRAALGLEGDVIELRVRNCKVQSFVGSDGGVFFGNVFKVNVVEESPARCRRFFVVTQGEVNGKALGSGRVADDADRVILPFAVGVNIGDFHIAGARVIDVNLGAARLTCDVGFDGNVKHVFFPCRNGESACAVITRVARFSVVNHQHVVVCVKIIGKRGLLFSRICRGKP